MPNFQPLTKTEHGDKCWQRHSSYAFAANDALVPLTLQELPKASRHYPIGFIQQGEDFCPAAIQGLTVGINLFVASDGRWLAPYVPAAYRGYPFVMATTASGHQVLCADMDSGLIAEEGEALFVDDQPSEAVNQVLGFLQAVQQNREVTARVCALLAQHKLIQPWPLKVTADEGEKTIEGIYRIDEQALKELPVDALAEVRDVGGLPVIYCQLLSMQNLSTLQTLAKLYADAQIAAASDLPQTDNRELDLEFLNRNDTIKF